MRTTAVLVQWIVRIAGITALLLGMLGWLGRGNVPAHMVLGFVVVLGLWTSAALALGSGVGWPLPIFALLWGVALPAVGMPHAAMLVGASHWVIRVVHLLMGLIAVGLADNLLRRTLVVKQRGAVVQPTRA